METVKVFDSGTVTAVMELISFSVAKKPLSDKAIYTPELCNNILELAAHHSILPIVFDALYNNGLLDLSDERIVALRKNHLNNVIRDERMGYQLKALSEVLQNAGIDHIPLKGAVIRRLFPESWMRTSCDIDVLVHPCDLESSVALLTDEMSCRYMCKTAHDVSLLAPGNVHIELHYDLIEENEREETSAVLRDVWKHSAPVEPGSHRYEMSNEMFMLYHIAHMAKHMLNGGCGIRPFIDLWLIRSRLDIDEAKLKGMLCRSRLEKFADEAYALCDVWFSGAEHSDLTERMQAYIFGGGVYGSLQNQLAVRRGKGEGRVRHFMNLAFLPRKNLEMVYPGLKNHPCLMPFYQVRRWFRVFNRKKRDKIAVNVSANKQLSEEKIEQVSDLMAELGLK